MKGPEGFLFSGIASGVKKGGKSDLGLIVSEGLSDAVCFFTENKVKAAPLILAAKTLKKARGRVKAIVVNSGSANCFTGRAGLADAGKICRKLAKGLRVSPWFVVSSSTGIIGKRLAVAKILKALPRLTSRLASDPVPFAKSILTTDTATKISSQRVSIKSKQVTVTGIAKGAGMIYPRLKQATMLGFILTDVNIGKALLAKTAQEAVESSFNSISVDGCSSTNDSIFVLSSRKAGNPFLKKGTRDFKAFSSALNRVCLELAQAIVKDGEGATKFIAIRVKGAASELRAREAGFAIANSTLFKTALYGANPNWGRIIQALGQAGIAVDKRLTIKASPLTRKTVRIAVDLKQGKASWTVYTSDLSPRYIKINAEYS